jgi:hypothetical protein
MESHRLRRVVYPLALRRSERHYRYSRSGPLGRRGLFAPVRLDASSALLLENGGRGAEVIFRSSAPLLQW